MNDTMLFYVWYGLIYTFMRLCYFQHVLLLKNAGKYPHEYLGAVTLPVCPFCIYALS